MKIRKVKYLLGIIGFCFAIGFESNAYEMKDIQDMPHLDICMKWCQTYNVDLAFLYSIWKQEGGITDDNFVSITNDIGCFQINADYENYYKKKCGIKNLYNFEDNVKVACWLIDNNGLFLDNNNYARTAYNLAVVYNSPKSLINMMNGVYTSECSAGKYASNVVTRYYNLIG